MTRNNLYGVGVVILAGLLAWWGPVGGIVSIFVWALIGTAMVANVLIVTGRKREPKLYHYTVDRLNGNPVTVYAANMHMTSHEETPTVIFTDHKGAVVAMYSMVRAVLTEEVRTEED